MIVTDGAEWVMNGNDILWCCWKGAGCLERLWRVMLVTDGHGKVFCITECLWDAIDASDGPWMVMLVTDGAEYYWMSKRWPKRLWWAMNGNDSSWWWWILLNVYLKPWMPLMVHPSITPKSKLWHYSILPLFIVLSYIFRYFNWQNLWYKGDFKSARKWQYLVWYISIFTLNTFVATCLVFQLNNLHFWSPW